jgi:hypothetical protein
MMARKCLCAKLTNVRVAPFKQRRNHMNTVAVKSHASGDEAKTAGYAE